jgi:peptidoglycan/xylan/chitin deacetylase (PgdA/CDA1 family)
MNLNVKLGLASSLDKIGLLASFRRFYAAKGGLVLTFHRVLKAADAARCYEPHMMMSEGVFEHLLALLSSEFQIVSLKHLIEEPTGSNRVQRVALTFDDGWEDTYSVAYPLLLRYRVPATVFLCSGLMDTEQQLPEERFVRIWNSCAHREQTSLLLQDLKTWGGTSGPSSASCRDWARHLKKLSIDTKLMMLTHLENTYRVPQDGHRRFLTWQEARIMSQTGIDFGSHTVRHATLSTETRETILRELTESRNTMERQLGVKPDYLAYPNGAFDNRVMQLTQEAGYTHAFGTRKGLLNLRTDPYAIPRIAMDDSTVTGSSAILNASRARLHLQPFRFRPVPRFLAALSAEAFPA